MRAPALFRDDDAVAPVIGIILMVAITVILAAIIAAFVLGLGDTDDPAPISDIEFDADTGENNLTISHQGGDSFEATQIEFAGDNVSGDMAGMTWDDALDEGWAEGDDGELDAGDRIEIDYGDIDGEVEYIEIELVWTSDDGETTEVIADYDGADA